MPQAELWGKRDDTIDAFWRAFIKMPDQPFTFSWANFSRSASIAIFGKFANDTELRAMVEAPSAPPKAVDEYGRPLPGSAIIEQHPEPDNYQWIIRQRRLAATQENDRAYLEYANQNLDFTETIGPFSARKPLFIGFFATHTDLYEFLYEPTSGSCIAMTFGHLGK